jgi:hypothetical protein
VKALGQVLNDHSGPQGLSFSSKQFAHGPDWEQVNELLPSPCFPLLPVKSILSLAKEGSDVIVLCGKQCRALVSLPRTPARARFNCE